MKNILVTGGAGFIGSNLVDRLIKEGHNVVVVDNLVTGKKEYVHNSAKLYELDVKDEDLKKVFRRENIDIVFHLATPSHPRISGEEQFDMIEEGVIGVKNLMKNVVEFGVKKIVTFSSLQVYGNNNNGVDENTKASPNTYLGLVHKLIEEIVRVVSEQNNIEYTILRCSSVFGFRQNDLGEGGMISRYMSALKNGSVPVVIGNVEDERDYIYVSDVVNAATSAMTKGNDEIYNIAFGSGRNLRAIAEAVIKKAKSTATYMEDGRDVEEQYYCNVNIKKAIVELVWRPVCTLEMGLDILNKKQNAV